jgi:phosphate transport system protein
MNVKQKLPRLDVNFFKLVIGVGFSLLWGQVMYLLWAEPPYLTFVWFYLIVGSVLLKWVIYKGVDMVHLRLRVRAVKEELDASSQRVHEVVREKNETVEPAEDAGAELVQKLKDLENEVGVLAAMTEQSLKDAVDCLMKGDTERAADLVKNDRRLDFREFKIRKDCLALLAAQSQNNEDLRKIVAVLGVITELERMGDYAKGIANITLMIGDRPSRKLLKDIAAMAEKSLAMLPESLRALFESDLEKAREICRMDNEIDSMYDEVFRDLLLSMVENPKAITQGTRMIWVAHNLERFADRTTNICEYAAFSITGRMVDIGASEY